MLRQLLTLSLTRKIVKSVIFMVFFVAFFATTKSVFAAICQPSYNPIIQPGGNTISFDLSSDSGPLVPCTNNPNNATCYEIRACDSVSGIGWNCGTNANYAVSGQRIDGKTISATINLDKPLRFWLEKRPASNVYVCGSTRWEIQRTAPSNGRVVCPNLSVVGVRNNEEITNYTFNDQLRVKIDGTNTSGWADLGVYRFGITENGQFVKHLGDFTAADGGKLFWMNGLQLIFKADLDIGQLGVSDYYQLEITDGQGGQTDYCTVPFAVSEDGDNTPPAKNTLVDYKVCDQIPLSQSKQKADCLACQNQHMNNGIWTAVGCIRTDATSIVKTFIQIGLGMAGGVALLMIIAAGFLFSTSQNDPKKVTEARDLVTSAVIGLLFILFSVTILQFIGVTILRIPGFGGQ